MSSSAFTSTPPPPQHPWSGSFPPNAKPLRAVPGMRGVYTILRADSEAQGAARDAWEREDAEEKRGEEREERWYGPVRGDVVAVDWALETLKGCGEAEAEVDARLVYKVEETLGSGDGGYESGGSSGDEDGGEDGDGDLGIEEVGGGERGGV